MTGAETNRPGWLEQVRGLTPEAKELFEKYSNVSPNEVSSHIKKIRDEAFKIRPYPCLATFAFLELMITQSPQYPFVLQRLKAGSTYLDMGCCVGQDIRKLVYDGAPSEKIYGCDLEQGFIDMGYDLFRDRESLKTTFVAADIFDPESGLVQLEGKMDVIHAALFLHLFDEGQCAQAVRRILRLFKDEKDVLFVGKQLGRVESGQIERNRFRHNAESFKDMWKRVSGEMGTQWEIEAWLEEEDLFERAAKMGVKAPFLPEGSRWLGFTVRRIA